MKKTKSDLISATKLIEQLEKQMAKFYGSTVNIALRCVIEAVKEARKEVINIETTEEWKEIRKEMEEDGNKV